MARTGMRRSDPGVQGTPSQVRPALTRTCRVESCRARPGEWCYRWHTSGGVKLYTVRLRNLHTGR